MRGTFFLACASLILAQLQVATAWGVHPRLKLEYSLPCFGQGPTLQSVWAARSRLGAPVFQPCGGDSRRSARRLQRSSAFCSSAPGISSHAEPHPTGNADRWSATECAPLRCSGSCPTWGGNPNKCCCDGGYTTIKFNYIGCNWKDFTPTDNMPKRQRTLEVRGRSVFVENNQWRYAA